MKKALEGFTDKNVQWLILALKSEHPEWTAKKNETAYITFSALEGAIIFSAMTENSNHLNKVSKSLKSLIAE